MSESAPPNAYPPPAPLSPEDEKLWSTLVHIGGIFFNFLPALIGYLILKDRGAFVRAHTVAALNFQITLVIALVVGFITALFVVGFLIIIAASILNLVFSIMAAVAANRGESYIYPLSIKFVN